MTTRTARPDPDERTRAAARARSLLRPAQPGDGPSAGAVLAAADIDELLRCGTGGPGVDAAELDDAELSDAELDGAEVDDAVTGPVLADPELAGDDLPEAPSSASRRPRRRWLAAGLGAIVVVLAAALGITASELAARDATASAARSALAAARVDALDLTTYDYRHLHADFSKVLANATPSFRSTYTTSSGPLEKVLGQYKATATGSVLAEGTVSATPGRVVALLFVNQTATNSTSSKPTTDESRLEMTLLRQHGRWLIDQVKLL